MRLRRGRVARQHHAPMGQAQGRTGKVDARKSWHPPVGEPETLAGGDRAPLRLWHAASVVWKQTASLGSTLQSENPTHAQPRSTMKHELELNSRLPSAQSVCLPETRIEKDLQAKHLPFSPSAISSASSVTARSAMVFSCIGVLDLASCFCQCEIDSPFSESLIRQRLGSRRPISLSLTA